MQNIFRAKFSHPARPKTYFKSQLRSSVVAIKPNCGARFKYTTNVNSDFNPRSTKPKRLRRLASYFFAGMLILGSSCVASPPAVAKGCDDVRFIFARGSGEILGDKSFTAWRDSITAALKGSTLQYSFYELGSQMQQGYRYPAVSVSDTLGGFGNLLGAYISKGESFEFGQSVVQGSRELQAYMRVHSGACPRMKFVLGGYSQGAMVLSRTLDELDSNKIIYTTTFGDPKLYLPEGKGAIPPACLGKSYSEYRVYVPDCRAYEGVLGSYRPYQPDGYDDRLGVWCNEKDIMCSSGVSVDDHTSYVDAGLYAGAARKVKTRLKRAFPDAFSIATSKPWASLKHNVVLLFDSTATMGRIMMKHRDSANAFADEIIDSGGSVAVADFRDLNDPYEPRIDCDFGCSPEEVHNSIKDIQVGGGGDNPESVLSALLYVMDNLDWQVGATKSIVLITDADYHSPDRDQTTLAQVVQRSREIDPVNVFTLTLAEYQDAYADLAVKTNGATFDIVDSNVWSDLNNQLLYRPEAILNASQFTGLVGDEFNFDASGSQASDGGDLRYDWDLDGDGTFEVQNGSAQIAKTYNSSFTDYIEVKVTDSQQRSATMTAKVTVLDSMSPLPEISAASFDEIAPDTFEIHLQTNAERILVSLDESPVGHLPGSTTDFILKDIKTQTSLHLVPYSKSIGRGQGITLTFGRQLPPDPTPSTPTPDQDSILPPSQPEPTFPPNSTPVSSTTSIPSTKVPKAPNTGVPCTASTSSGY